MSVACGICGRPMNLAGLFLRECARSDSNECRAFAAAAYDRDQRIAALETEVARLRKLFDDAGQGEHNVLALVDHYQAEAIRADDRAAELAAQVRADERRIAWHVGGEVGSDDHERVRFWRETMDRQMGVQ